MSITIDPEIAEPQTAGASLAQDLFERHSVIDVDTHLTEPPDVWTARMPTSMHDQVPHIERIDGKDVWMVSGERLGAPGYYSMAGWDGVMPASTPGTYDEIHPSMYDSAARLRF
ncbi:MAG: amidohydrolase 2, partial [Acidimicrobiales bacterium]|nr:amidohydrolase 2 [Acidimicrobiales bacterium]